MAIEKIGFLGELGSRTPSLTEPRRSSSSETRRSNSHAFRGGYQHILDSIY